MQNLNTDTVDFEYEDETPPIANPAHAEAHLHALNYWRYQAEEIEAHAQKQIERAQLWKEAELKKIAPRIQYHESGLIAYIQNTGKKTITLINGTIKRIAGRDRVEITDTDTLIAWANRSPQTQSLLRTKTEPDKTAIMNHIKTTGEMPEGAELVTGSDSFKIVTE